MSEGQPPLPLDATPPPPPPPVTFPEYGQGGDYAGQRRSRRSFRYAVLATVAFVVALRVYDGYAKLELRETQYVSSLTLHPASARPILRNIVKRETEAKGQPTPLYVEALAAVEEDERILPTFEEAARLAPSNTSLLMKYGCALFQQRDFEKAREKFREAGAHPPRNALPNYLEAAALAAGRKGGVDLSEPMAIVARANNGGAPVVFPVPLWHGTLPKQGEHYAEYRRDMSRKICAPLLQFKQLLVEHARHDIETKAYGDWDAWLEQLQEMGHRMATAHNESNEAESTQVTAGINVEMDALALRKEIAAATGGDVKALEAQYAQLGAAMAKFTDFENQRQAGIDRSRGEAWRPLHLLEWAIQIFLLAYLLVWAYGSVMRADPRAVALSHTRLGGGVLLGGLLALGLALYALAFTGDNTGLAAAIEHAADALVMVLVLFGAIYPTLSLPRVKSALAPYQPAPTELAKAALQARRSAGVALARRYYGVLLGGIFVAMALWVVAYRLQAGIYPDQLELLVSGMERVEQETIASALAGLP